MEIIIHHRIRVGSHDDLGEEELRQGIEFLEGMLKVEELKEKIEKKEEYKS